MVIALMFVTMIGGATWAWSFQQRALRLLQQRPSHLARQGRDGGGLPTSMVVAGRAAGGNGAGSEMAAEAAPGRVALAERPRPDPADLPASPAPQAPISTPALAPAPPSVLGWEAFAIASTLVLGGTALVGCTRRADPDFADVVADGTGDVAAGASSGAAETATFVLLLGEDERAAQAHALLDAWCQGADVLRLRPAPVPGAIEVYDRYRRALRAGLLAA